MKAFLVLVLLLLPAPLWAQGKPVVQWADWTSYGTAAVNPAWEIADAWRGPNRTCELARLGISEAVGNAIGLTLQRFITSPRPCAGCPPHGMPSEHVINSAMGMSSHWQIGLGLTFGTAVLRVHANRHTWPQVLAGMGVGIGADYAGHLLNCDVTVNNRP